jgi:WD40 repeat protein
MRETLLPEQTNLLVLVDQFEEIFRYREQQNSLDDAEAFVDLLLAAAQHPSQVSHGSRVAPVYVVITMRSDFYGECALFLGLPEVINESQLLTPRLSREQCQAAIQGPARAKGGNLDAALVNRLLNDMRGLLRDASGGADQLPLLQHALMRMWETATNKLGPPQAPTLTVADLERAGGLNRALSQHADEAFYGLDGDQQRVAEVMFRCLCDLGPGRRATRRLAKVSDVAAIAGVSADEVMRVADAFRRSDRSFLMPPAEVPLTPDTVLDISHESLIRQWGRLRDWSSDEAQSADTYRRVTETAELWRKGEARLWGTPDLDVAEQWRLHEKPTARWASRYGGNFELAMQFLDASQRERDKRHRRRRRFVAALVGGSVFAATVSTGVAFYVSGLRKEAVAKRDEAEQQRLLAEKREDEAKRATIIAESERTKANQSKILADRSAYNAQLARVESSWRDNQELANDLLNDNRCPVALRDFTWRLYSQLANKRPTELQGHGAAVNCVAQSIDGRWLASGDEHGQVILWDPEMPSKSQQFALDFSAVLSLAFSPDGKTLVVAGTTNLDADTPSRIVLLNHETKEQRTLTAGVGPVRCVTISADGHWLASAGDDGKVRLWTFPAGQLERTMDGHTDWVTCVTFSPDTTKLVSGSRDATVQMWQVATGERVAISDSEHTDAVLGVCFSVDGKLLASCGEDETIRLWEVDRLMEAPQLIEPRAGVVYAVDFSVPSDASERDLAEDSVLVSAHDDGIVKLWGPVTARETVTLRGTLRRHTGAVRQVAARGGRLASAGTDRRVMLWDPQVGLRMYEDDLRIPGAPVEAIAISPDDQTVATLTRAESPSSVVIQRWRILQDNQPTNLGEPLKIPLVDAKHGASSSGQDSFSLNFVGGATTLAVCSSDGLVQLWDAEKRELIKDLTSSAAPAEILTMASYADILAAGCSDGKVRLWNALGESRQVVDFDKEFAGAVALTVDGRYLAAGSEAGKIGLWRREDGSQPFKPIGAPVAAHQGAVTALAFADTDQQLTLASASRDGMIWFWDPDTGQYRGTLEGHSSAVRSLAFHGEDLMLSADQTSVKFWRAPRR